MTQKVTGQLWYTDGQSGANDGEYGPAGVGDEAGVVNSDGTTDTTLLPPSTVYSSSLPWYTGIAVDTAAGYYWVVDNASANLDSPNGDTTDPNAQYLLEYKVGTNAPVGRIQIAADAAAGDLTNNVVIDTLNHKLYVSTWGDDQTVSGIQAFSYNPANGATTPVVTGLGGGSANYVVVGDNTGNQDAANTAVSNITAMALDAANQLLYFVADDAGYDFAPFAPSNAVYVKNLATNSLTQLTSSTQFPASNANGVDPNGVITGVAVDAADNKVFFLIGADHSNSGALPAPSLWYVSANGGANQTATQLALPSGALAGEWLNASLSYDPVNKQLYIDQQENSSGTGGGEIVVAQLNSTGTSVTGIVTTIPQSSLESGGVAGDVPLGTDFVSLPDPVFTANGAPAVENGAAVTLLGAGSTSTDASNGDYVKATVQITGGAFSSNESSAADDHLSLGGAGTVGTNIAASYDASTETLTLSGYDLVADYNKLLQEVQYSVTGANSTDYGQDNSRTITWTIDDGQSNIPAGAQNSTTTTVEITPVHTAPVLGGGGNSTTSYSPLGVPVPVDGGLTVSDVDSLTLASATVRITSGLQAADLLNFTAQNGISGSYDAATGALSLSGTASVADYQTALDSITYSSTSADPEVGGADLTRTVSWSVNDGFASNAASNSVTSTVNVGAAAPVFSGGGTTVNYPASGAPVAIDNTLTLGADDTIEQGGVLIDNYVAGDQLHFTNQNGISGVYSSGELLLTGAASAAAYQQALASVTFSSTASDPENAGASPTRTITFGVLDSQNNAASVNATVDVGPVAPLVSSLITPAIADYLPGGGAVALDPGLTVSSPDSPILTGATVSIGFGFQSGDLLNYVNQNGIVGTYDSADGVLSLTGAASVANYQSALDSIAYSSTSADPEVGGTDANRDISWTVTDGLSSNAASNSFASAVYVAPSAPALSGAGNLATYPYGGPAVAVDAGLTVASDVELTGATVTIANGFLTGDQLNFTNTANIAGSFNGDELVLSGTASAAAYQAALESVTFSSSNPDDTSGGADLSRTVSWMVSDGASANAISNTVTSTIDVLPCYCAATRILTARGEIAVEDLREGDLALTESGRLRPIRWIGRRALKLASHAAPEKVWPVRIRAGAFGTGRPCRDLWVSPGHNIPWRGALIPAILLANGQTVEQIHVESVTYYHVELDAHDILLADGLPAESYLDCGNRTAFENGGGALELHPDFEPKWPGDACLPIAKSGAGVEAAKAHLLARARNLGFALTDDPDLRLLADGQTIRPRIEGPRHIFSLPEGARKLRLVSRVWSPGHMRPDSADDRRLGVLVTRLECDGARQNLAALGQGWQAVESPDWRWTQGEAVLPGARREIAVEIGGAPLYWRERAATAPLRRRAVGA